MKSFIFTLTLLCSIWSMTLVAQLRLPHLVSDSMVLQRDTEVVVWGWAKPGEKVKLTMGKERYHTRTNAEGEWCITLPAHPAGGPYEIKLQASNEIVLKDVLFGDVWLCAGQSNMVHYMKIHRILYAEDIATANYPEIRHFAVPGAPELSGPAQDFKGGAWKGARPENVRDFSAVAYFFALDIHQKYDIPIGLINASVGGTPIEAWTSKAGLVEFPAIIATISRNEDAAYVDSVNSVPDRELRAPELQDRGLTGAKAWYDEAYEPQGWQPINVPGYWEDQGLRDLNGTVWYRREVELPAAMAKQKAEVFLGRIIDADELYINGEQIGRTTYQYPQRRYAVPADLLRAGQNTFVVKVNNYGGKGGFVPDRPYEIHTITDTVDLKGTWQYRVGEVFAPRRVNPPVRISAQHQPAALFNGMIAPATDYAIKGVLWYQGESNAGRPESYANLQAAQIADFRQQWEQEDLPFLFVQLPGFMDYAYLPTESNWAEMREAQRQTLTIPHTGMAIAIDLGEWNDIHPDNKKGVGERLALLARQQVYKEDIVASGPLFKSATVEGGKVKISFTHVGSGLVSKDGEKLREFALAGYDGEFHWAEARIVGEHIEVSHPDIAYPHYLRYAWSDNPRVNLYNAEGLPASPFQATVGDAQPPRWRGKSAAVVLTYDDALHIHLDQVIPALDRRGFKGTFYLSAAYPGSTSRITDWRRAAANGHELGNHTLHHPCDASKPGRNWVASGRDLSQYTTERIVNEIHMANAFLESVDGQTSRTFAYTCGDMETGEGSFVPEIKEAFIAARGVQDGVNTIEDINMHNIKAVSVNGQSGAELIEWVKRAEAENALLVFLFHGVGGEHHLNVSAKAHRELLDYLAEREESLWVTTMLEAAEHVRAVSK